MKASWRLRLRPPRCEIYGLGGCCCHEEKNRLAVPGGCISELRPRVGVLAEGGAPSRRPWSLDILKPREPPLRELGLSYAAAAATMFW